MEAERERERERERDKFEPLWEMERACSPRKHKTSATKERLVVVKEDAETFTILR